MLAYSSGIIGYASVARGLHNLLERVFLVSFVCITATWYFDILLERSFSVRLLAPQNRRPLLSISSTLFQMLCVSYVSVKL
mmetsp:Transcript_59091/g.97800  ORF Transcript_59091/g.97800 Transcript_59091/m.97800 type:complete len:81 (-) Transcript_59091:43-285(-)